MTETTKEDLKPYEMGEVKKYYVRPVLTKHGAVTKLTAAATGSLVEMLRPDRNG